MPLLSEELQRPNRNICLREFRFDLFIKDHHIRFANVEYCVSFEGENLKVELSHDKTKHSNPCHARLTYRTTYIQISGGSESVNVSTPFSVNDGHNVLEELLPGHQRELREHDELHFGHPGVFLKVAIAKDDVQVDSSLPPDTVFQNGNQERNPIIDERTLDAALLAKDSFPRHREAATPVPSLARTGTEKVEDTPATASRFRSVQRPITRDANEIYSTAQTAPGEPSQAESEPPRKARGNRRHPVLTVEETTVEENIDLDGVSEIVPELSFKQPPATKGPQTNELNKVHETAVAELPARPIAKSVAEIPSTASTEDSSSPPASNNSRKRAADDDLGEEVLQTKKRGRPPKAKSGLSVSSALISDKSKRNRKSLSKDEPTPDVAVRGKGSGETEGVDTPINGATSKSTTPKQPEASPSNHNLLASDPPRVVYSNSTINQKVNLAKFLTAQGVKEVTDPLKSDFDILCTSKGELKKTAKLLLAVALGKQIVNDSWVIDSSRAGHLLAYEDYLPHDPIREADWEFKLKDTIGNPRDTLFSGQAIYFTPTVKKEYGSSFAEIQDIIKKCGAAQVFSTPARDLITDNELNCPQTIIIAAEHGDLDATTLMEKQATCYTKDLISLSIFRGRLAMDDNKFVINPSSSGAPKNARKASTRRR